MPKPLFKIKIKTPKTSTEIRLTQDETTVGRSAENEICIESVGISRKHLKITIADGELTLTDLGSTNGTFYKGKKLMPSLPVDYFGGPLNLGPTSDGNIVEIVDESAVKEVVQTSTRARTLAKPIHQLEPDPAVVEAERSAEIKRETKQITARLEPFSHDPSRSIIVERREQPAERGEEQESIMEVDPREVEALNKELDGSNTPSVLYSKVHTSAVEKPASEPQPTTHELTGAKERSGLNDRSSFKDGTGLNERSGLREQSGLRDRTGIKESTSVRESTGSRRAEPARKSWDSESENSILLSVSRQLEVKAELDRLRARQEEVERELREAELKKHEIQDEIRELRQEMSEQENRLTTLREKIKDEDSRFRKKTVELEEGFNREESYFKTRREELERDQKTVDKLQKETTALKAELSDIKQKLEKDLESEKTHFSHEHEKLMKEHRAAKIRTEDEFRKLKEKLENSHAAQESELSDTHKERKAKLEKDHLDRTQVIEDEHKALIARNVDEHDTQMRRLSAEQAALSRKLEEESERLRAESEREKTRLSEELKGYRQKTESETARLQSEHKALAVKLADDEKDMRDVFESQQKTHKIRLERLVAEIELRDAQEQKVIEQRRTEKVVAERELNEIRKSIEESKKDLERLIKEVATANEKLDRRRSEESDLKQVIAVHEELESKLQAEYRKLNDLTESKRVALAKLEAEFTEQQKKNKTDRETAVKLAHEEKTSIISEGQKRADDYEAKTRKEMDELQAKVRKEVDELQETTQKEMDEFQATTRKNIFDEVNALRAAAQAEVESDLEEWKSEFAARKAREQNEMNLWAADEKKKLQDRLSGDMDGFVDSVTRTALSKVGENPNFTSLIHEFHKKFGFHLKNALTNQGNETVAPFNPDRKQETKSFWVKSAVASVIVVILGITAYYAPDAIREAANERRTSHDDGATGEWIKKIQAERELRLALKLETRTEFQPDYANNVLYNEGYLEMKLDTNLQNLWVKELNNVMTGEKTMGMDEEALVDYVRTEHSLFIDLSDKKGKMNGINKDEYIAQMKTMVKDAKVELLAVLKNKVLPSSDRARMTTPEQKWNTIRALEQRFYNEQVVANTRRPASTK